MILSSEHGVTEVDPDLEVETGFISYENWGTLKLGRGRPTSTYFKDLLESPILTGELLVGVSVEACLGWVTKRLLQDTSRVSPR